MLASIVWDVDPTIFEIAGRQIRWYGLMWGLGFILAYKYGEWLFKKEKYPEEWVDKLFVYSLISVVVGARLGHCLFYQWDYYTSNPVEILCSVSSLRHGSIPRGLPSRVCGGCSTVSSLR